MHEATYYDSIQAKVTDGSSWKAVEGKAHPAGNGPCALAQSNAAGGRFAVRSGALAAKINGHSLRTVP